MRRRLTAVAAIVARGGALFLGAFVLVGLVGELRGRQTDIELWFVDVRDIPVVGRVPLVAAFGTLLVGWAILGGRRRWLPWATAATCLVFAALAVRDVIRFADVVSRGSVHPAWPVPFSAVVAAALIGLAILAIRMDRGHDDNAPPRVSWRHGGALLASALGWAILFPVAQIGFFGTTDYRRPADAAVVFGARVYASGAPSPLLADRIATAVDLYRSGDAPILLMSGGDGADGFNEAAVMREVALGAGVASGDVVVDDLGVSTEATVANTMAWVMDQWDSVPPTAVRVIAVSQPYHLPRIQLAFAAAGIDVLTVPAVDPVPISEMPLLVAREIPAFWAYYLRQCLG